MLSTNRREAELAFDRQREKRLARGVGQWRVAHLPVLRQRERARGRAELLHNPYARAPQIDVRASQRVQLTGPQPREGRDLEPRSERLCRKLTRAADQLPDLLLARRLLVPAPRATRNAKPRERVAANHAAALGRGGVVEHRQARGRCHCEHRPQATPRLPRPRSSPSAGTRSTRRTPRALPIVDVRGLLRPREQGISGPACPKGGERGVRRGVIAEAFARLLACALGVGLRRKGPRAAEHTRDAHVVPARRVIDLCPPPTRRQSRQAHAALPRSAAHPSAIDGRKRRVRRPHVTDGIPSATMRSTVATLTPISRASSLRDT